MKVLITVCKCKKIVAKCTTDEFNNKFIQNKKRIVTGVHPSPLAQGFLGSGVFKKVEAALGQPIDWRLHSD